MAARSGRRCKPIRIGLLKARRCLSAVTIAWSPDSRMTHFRKFTNLLPQQIRFGYGGSDFVARMAAAGFETTVFRPFESHPEQAEAWCLNPLEGLPIGRKA